MSFIYHGPLPPDSLLFRNRINELDWLARRCYGEVSSYPIIYGGRQNGKTSLLLRFEASLAERLRVCFIDFQSLPRANSAQVYAYIAQRVSERLPFATTPVGISDSQSLIRYLCQTLETPEVTREVTRLILILEEFGALEINTRHDVANVLRAMFTGRHTSYRPLSRLQIVLAGGIELFNLAATDVSTLHNICDPVYLDDLAEPEAIALIADGLRDSGVERETGEQLGREVFTYARGHPYLTQRMGGLLEASVRTSAQPIPKLVELVAQQVSGDDPLLRSIRRSVREEQLEDATGALLQGKVRFSRLDDEMARLELIGAAKGVDGVWRVRNSLLAEVLADLVGLPFTSVNLPSLGTGAASSSTLPSMTSTDSSSVAIENRAAKRFLRRSLEQRLDSLLQEYEVVNQQIMSTLDEVDRVRLHRKAESLFAELERLEEELRHYPDI